MPPVSLAIRSRRCAVSCFSQPHEANTHAVRTPPTCNIHCSRSSGHERHLEEELIREANASVSPSTHSPSFSSYSSTFHCQVDMMRLFAFVCAALIVGSGTSPSLTPRRVTDPSSSSRCVSGEQAPRQLRDHHHDVHRWATDDRGLDDRPAHGWPRGLNGRCVELHVRPGVERRRL